MPCLNFNRKIIAIEMKSIIITGGTRGIGYGLADAFLSRGCAVTICGRDANATKINAIARIKSPKAPSDFGFRQRREGEKGRGRAVLVEISPVEASQVPTRALKSKKSVDFWAAQISQVRGELDANLRSILSFFSQKQGGKKRF